MSMQKKGYPTLIIRSSILIGYLFLFIAQSNYQYFDLANFFVYGHEAASSAAGCQHENKAATAVSDRQEHAPQHSLALQSNNKQRIGHLAIDKRYKFQQGLRIPPIRAPGSISYTFVRTRFCIPAPTFTSADLPTNALRGPPSAA
jgi:hypothetical protein